MNIKDYNEAERMIYRVASVIGFIGEGIIPARMDGSHHCLKWDETRKMLVSRTFTIGDSTPMYMGFNTSLFRMSFITAKNDEKASIDVEDLTARELLMWSRNWLEKQGVWVIPELDLSHDVDVWDIVIKRPHDEFLFMWMALRSQASRMLQSLSDLTGHVCQVIISPEKLESKVHYTMHTELGQETHVIEAGLAMSGHPDVLPYYFVRGKGKMSHVNLDMAPAMHHVTWFGGGWIGAHFQVLDDDKFPASQDVLQFLEQSYEFLCHHVMVD